MAHCTALCSYAMTIQTFEVNFKKKTFTVPLYAFKLGWLLLHYKYFAKIQIAIFLSEYINSQYHFNFFFLKI